MHIAVTAPESAPALAVPGAAEQIIDNLIDNALAVSPAGTTIGVTVTPASDTVDLHVLDEGPGMSLAGLRTSLRPVLARTHRHRWQWIGPGHRRSARPRERSTAELTPRTSDSIGTGGLDAHIRFARSRTRHYAT